MQSTFSIPHHCLVTTHTHNSRKKIRTHEHRNTHHRTDVSLQRSFTDSSFSIPHLQRLITTPTHDSRNAIRTHEHRNTSDIFSVSLQHTQTIRFRHFLFFFCKSKNDRRLYKK